VSITFEQLFQSITQQESGGNYGALGIWLNMSYGRDRAYGRYQVMGNNIPSWTKQYLGHSLTPQQYLNDQSAQDKVARGRLKELFDKYGARGAASAWYSGSPSKHMNTAPQSGGPSIKQYVDEVIARGEGLSSGGSGSQGSVTSTRTGGGSQSVPDKPADPSAMAEQYGYVEALFNAVPELKALFQKAVKGKWDGGKFQAELRDTKWWKSKPESVRKFLTEQAGDPATAKQKIDQMVVKITQAAGALGAPTDYKTMRDFAVQALMNGWTDGQVRWNLAKKINLKRDRRPGEAGENLDKLAGLAYDMGVKVSDQWADDAARKIAGGAASLQDYEDQIRRMAKGQYSMWSKQIDAGQSVADLASPYLQSMATILELAPGSINLFDPTIKKSLTAKGPDGKSMIKPMWQFENELRADPRWKKTKNAQESVMQVTHQVLSDFGLRY